MPTPNQATPQHIYEELRDMISGLRDDLAKVKVQTGELASTREQINSIDRMLRGYNGQRGLVGRFDLVEQGLTHLITVQIPALIEAAKSNARSDLEICQANRLLEHERLKGDIEILRTEYQAYIAQAGKDDEREQKEEAKFGGREWFRENASGILIAVITALVMLIVSGVAQEIIAALQHH